MGLATRRGFGALVAIAFGLLPALVQPISAGAASTGTLFGMTGPFTLSKIDPVSGTITPLGTVPGGPNDTQVVSLAGDPATHRIFGVQVHVTVIPPGTISMTLVILTFNSQTGAFTVSPPVNSPLGGLQFDPLSNTLYALVPSGFQGANGVVRINPTTGVVSPVASIGPGGPFIDQMAVAPQTHTVYVSRENIGGPIGTATTRLFAVNTLTGAGPSIQILGRAIRTIAYDSSSNKLLGITECCPRDLVEIDPVSGTETFVGNINNSNAEIFTVNTTVDPASHTLFTVLETPKSIGFGFDDHILSINTQTGVSTSGPAMPVGIGSLYFESTGAPPDTSPPSTSIALSPAPNGAGWNKSDVTVNLSATDPDGVADVAAVHYGATGAQTIAPTVVAGSTASFVVNTEGVTTVTYFANDKAGNTEASHTQVIRIDKTLPTVTYSGNAGTYTVDHTVNITCTAVDPPNANGTAGSGVASTTCANVNAPAYSFPLGANTRSASATDMAGNVGSGSTTFTVKVTSGSLCELTVQFVETSPKFLSLSPHAQKRWDRRVNELCELLDEAQFSTEPEDKAEVMADYSEAVTHLVHKGFLTPAQAAILITLSRAL